MKPVAVLAETRLGAGWPPFEESAAFYYLLATCEGVPARLWETLIAPLAQELDASGLGRIPNLDSLRREATELGRIEIDELVIPLSHLEYGRELVEQAIRTSGLPLLQPAIPPRWRDYPCAEYFSHGWWERGHFSELSELWVIAPLRRARETADIDFLSVGTSGCDGIDFGYRKGYPGLWAYFPIRDEFQAMASTIPELVEGWCSGRLTV